MIFPARYLLKSNLRVHCLLRLFRRSPREQTIAVVAHFTRKLINIFIDFEYPKKNIAAMNKQAVNAWLRDNEYFLSRSIKTTLKCETYENLLLLSLSAGLTASIKDRFIFYPPR